MKKQLAIVLHKTWYHVFHATTAKVARRTEGGFLSGPALFMGKIEKKAAYIFGVLGPFHRWLQS